MSLLKRLFDYIVATFYALALFAVGCLVVYSFWISVDIALAVIFTILVAPATIFIGLKVFKTVIERGAMEIMTAVHATPDLDNLLPAESSETKVCTPAEMAALINSSTIRVKTGLMRIFSQEIEINGQDLFTLESSKFFPDVDVLLINLSGDVQVKIRHPKIIFQSSTFLKIVRAQEIRIEYRRSDSDCYINFKTSEKQSIEAKKNDGNIGTLRKANSAYPAFDFLA